MGLFDTVLNLLGARRPVIEQRVKLATQAMQEAKQRALKDLFTPTEQEEDIGAALWFSNVETIDLGKAHTNSLIWHRLGRALFIIEFTGGATGSNTQIRFNTVNSPVFPVRSGYIKSPFNKIYLTNTAQAGKTLKFVVAYHPFAEFQITSNIDAFKVENDYNLGMIKQYMPCRCVNVPVIYNVAMALADTEYDQALGNEAARCISVRFGLQDFTEFRYAWVTGKVAAPTAPFVVIPAAGVAGSPGYVEIFQPGEETAWTLFFASPAATKVMQIEMRS